MSYTNEQAEGHARDAASSRCVVADLLHERDELRSQVAGQNTALRRKADELRDVTAERDSARQNYDETRGAYLRVQAERDELRGAAAELKQVDQAANDNDHERDRWQREAERLKAECDSTGARLNMALLNLSDMTTQRDTARADYERIRARCDHQRRRISDLVRECAIEREQRDISDLACAAMGVERDKLRDEVGKLGCIAGDMEHERDEAREQLSEQAAESRRELAAAAKHLEAIGAALGIIDRHETDTYYAREIADAAADLKRRHEGVRDDYTEIYGAYVAARGRADEREAIYIVLLDNIFSTAPAGWRNPERVHDGVLAYVRTLEAFIKGYRGNLPEPSEDVF